MKFAAVQNMKNKDIPTNSIVLEAVKGTTIDVQGQNMQVYLLTDKMIENSNVKPVSNSIWFKDGNTPTEDGLFSPLIFGETARERHLNHGYIDLKRKFFHPYVYEVIRKVFPKVDTLAMGQGSWFIDEDGHLQQIMDKADERYNEDNTGLDWLITNFHKIKWKETGSRKREERLELLYSLTDDELFISKWIVVPIFFRDYSETNGKKSIPDINYMYNSLIIGAASFDNNFLSIAKHITLFKMQNTLIDIRKQGQALIEKKNGAFQKSVLGKSVDYGGRGVITAPSLNGCHLPDDTLVDITHSGIPLAYCITLGYPFMIKWVTEFFEETFRNKRQIPMYIKNEKGEYDLIYDEIADQTEIFTKDFIDRKMEMFKRTYGAERFETIKIKRKNGEMAEMYFPGRGYGGNIQSDAANTISNRPMTWTDIFYLAAYETLSDKHCYITRYPLLDYFGTYPSQVAVLSTIKTAPAIINGKVYKHYPVIDLSMSKEQMATQFIDTFSISNLYLDAIGGDYDGDTVSAKILFSIEANDEAADQIRDIKHYLNVQGKLVRVLGNETFLTFYNLTRRK